MTTWGGQRSEQHSGWTPESKPIYVSSVRIYFLYKIDIFFFITVCYSAQKKHKERPREKLNKHAITGKI